MLRLLIFAAMNFVVFVCLVSPTKAVEFDPIGRLAISNPKEVEASELQDILQDIAFQCKANYEQIQTLSAEYSFEDCFLFEGAMTFPKNEKSSESGYKIRSNIKMVSGRYWEITTGSAACLFDARRELYQCNYVPSKVYFANLENKPFAGQQGDLVHWILSPEYFIEFFAEHNHGPLKDSPPLAHIPTNGGRVLTRHPSESAQEITRVVDWRMFFSNGTDLFFDVLSNRCNVLDGKKTPEIKEYLEKNLRAYRGTDGSLAISLHFKQGESEAILVDPSVGYNVTQYRLFNSQGDISLSRDVSFVSVEDCFIPKNVLLEGGPVILPSGTIPSIVRNFELVNADVNSRLPKGTFDEMQLGLVYGERLEDKIRNELFVVDKSQVLTPASEFVYDPQYVNPSPTSWWRIVAMGAAVVGFVLMIAIALMRRK